MDSSSSSTAKLNTPNTLFKVKDFDDSKVATLEWDLPSDIANGKYYLQASGLGLTSYSQAIQISPSGTKRRHYV